MPSIDSLPYDVLCLIFSQFQAEDRAQIKHVHPRQRVRSLAAWAATSRKWQEIAERRIWNQIIIRSVHSLEELARCTTGSSSQRACYVRRIYWWPYIDNTVCSCLPESDLCHQERRVSFLCKTAWLDFTQRMLEVLHSWGDSHPGVELVLYSNNGDIPQSRVLAIPVEERRVGQRGSSVPIKLTKENLLGSRHPPCVNKFQVLDTGNECVGLGTMFEIMRCFPSLKDVCGEGYLMPPKPLEQRDRK
ncbi:hypothetical protein BJX61DRAFT_525962 [Aspergillus egyptiacus]|nr:hypothetical protein BJX61DRAFT_525962 [Aspergillus egyptiacus]